MPINSLLNLDALQLPEDCTHQGVSVSALAQEFSMLL